MSYSTTFLPTTFQDKKNYQTFTEHDPYQMEPVQENCQRSPKDPFREIFMILD